MLRMRVREERRRKERKDRGDKERERESIEIEIRRTNEIPDGNWKHAWSRRVTGRGQMQWRLLFNIGATHGRTPRHISLILQPASQPASQAANQPTNEPTNQPASQQPASRDGALSVANALHISRHINIFNAYEYCRGTETYRKRDRERDNERRRWCTHRLNHCAYLGLHKICSSISLSLFHYLYLCLSLLSSLIVLRQSFVCFLLLATAELFPRLWIRN